MNIFYMKRGDTISKCAKVIFIIGSFLLFLPSVVMGQSINLNHKNSQLKTILEEVTKQSGYGFAYSDEIDPSSIIVNAYAKDEDVLKFLKSFLSGNSIEYRVIGKTISLSKIKSANDSKHYKITGRVVDENGDPITGAYVFVKGTNNGVVTGVDGDYELSFTNANSVIEYTFFSMKSQSIEYKGQSVINVTLVQEQTKLDEIVVTGYQSISKERASGSFEKLSVKALDNKVSFNIIDKLEGQTTGVLFDNNKVSVRGIASMKASTEPLVVVDGFPIEGSMESVNPNDIKSVTVLKDAAAASIWGARASNGVIVIESKSGTNKEKANIEFYSSFSFSKKPDLYSLNRVSSSTLVDVEQHLVDNSWITPPTAGPGARPPRSAAIDAMFDFKNGVITEAERDAILNGLRSIDVRDEYSKLFHRGSVRQDYNLAISGASERNNYYASFNYGDDLTSLKGVSNDRIIANLRLRSNISKHITFNAALSASIINVQSNGAPGIDKISSYQRILDSNGDYINQPYGYEQAQKDARIKEYSLPYDWNYNMYREFVNSDNSSKSLNLRLQTGLNIKIIDGLDIEGRYQYEWGNSKGKRLYNEDTYYVRDLVNSYAYLDGTTGTLVYPIPLGYIRDDDNTYNKSFTARAQLNFNRSFNDSKHQIYAIAGVEFRQTETESSNMEKYGYDPVSLQYTAVNYNYDYLKAFSTNPSKITDPTAYSFVMNRYASYYGNAGYTLLNKYTFTGSVRLDDSNLFGSSRRYRSVPLWSAGFNWQIDKENFMNLDFVDRLVFRATYGSGGNIDRNTSPYLIADVLTEYYQSYKYAAISNPKNPNLRWEKTYTANVGLDFSLWNNTLNGSIEYYNRKSVDLLGNVSINSLYGFTEAFMNTAKMSNKGIDLSVGITPIKGNLVWNITNRFSYNKNRVLAVELANNTVSGAVGVAAPRVGKPLNHIYSYRWAGLSSEGKPQIYNEKGEKIDSATPMQSLDGLKYQGSITPRYYGSLQNELSYKGFYFSLLTTYKFGYKFFVPTVDYMSVKNDINVNTVHSDFNKRWQKPGDENVTNVPVFPADPLELSGYWSDYVKYGSNLVKSASHIRFKEIILSYSLPKSWFKGIYAESITVGAQVRDLGVITFNGLKIDPENIVGASGVGKLMPEYTLSLRVQF